MRHARLWLRVPDVVGRGGDSISSLRTMFGVVRVNDSAWSSPPNPGGDKRADDGGDDLEGLPAAQLRLAACARFHSHGHFLDLQARVAEPEEGFDFRRFR